MRYIVPEDKMIKMIGLYLKETYPRFNKEDSSELLTTDDDENYYEYYDPKDLRSFYVKYNIWTHELKLHWRLEEDLIGMFGEDNLHYFVDWFNYEFGKDAESIEY